MLVVTASANVLLGACDSPQSGATARAGQTTEVFVGGTLIGSYEEGEQLERNAILVQLAADPRCHLGRLAEAFDMSTERLRQLRREYEAGGMEALRPGKDGGPRRLSEREVARLAQAFERGLAPTAAHATMKGVSLSTVRRAHRAWRATRTTKPIDDPRAPAAERTLALPGIDMLPTPRSADGEADKPDAFDLLRKSPLVQHASAWILTAMLARFGVYDVVGDVAVGRVDEDAARVGLDATIATFAIGETSREASTSSGRAGAWRTGASVLASATTTFTTPTVARSSASTSPRTTRCRCG